MFFLRVRPQSVSGKKTGKMRLSHAIFISFGLFAAFSALYLMGVRETTPDKDAEARAVMRKKFEYQFELAAARFAGILPAPATVPAGFPPTLSGKTAVVGRAGQLLPVHWQLPADLCAELPDEVKNLILVSMDKETPGVAAKIYVYNLEKKSWLGKVEIKRTPDMEGRLEYTLINGAVGDALWAWTEKLSAAKP